MDFKRPAMINAMTVDVEDYFQVSAFEDCIDRDAWDSLPCRVERNTERVLGLFDDHGVKATFFMLGWVAERYPGLVRRIADGGHEVASHGYGHMRVDRMSPEDFHADASRTRELLEDIAGVPVRGYRAPSYSINGGNLWAFDVLQAAGYTYSSSVYPVRHDLYGMPEAPRFPYSPGAGALVEIPVTTVRAWGQNLPCGGGGYFRLLPYFFSRWAIRRVNRRERQPAIFYFHPWELDPDQPRQTAASRKARFRHYLNLAGMERRLTRLLQDFAWGRVDEVYARRLSREQQVPEPAPQRSPGERSPVPGDARA